MRYFFKGVYFIKIMIDGKVNIIKKINLFKFGKKRVNRKLRVRNSGLRKINNLLKSRERLDKLSLNFFNFIHEYLNEYFYIRRELTYDELKEVINKKRVRKDVKMRLFMFLVNVAILEFSVKKLKKQDLKKLMFEFKKIIRIL